MKKTFTVILLLSATVLLTNCEKKMTPTSKAPAAKVTYTAEQQEKGKTICEGSCQKCHVLHQPGEFTVNEWDKILPGMFHKAKLGDDQQTLVRAWVESGAKG